MEYLQQVQGLGKPDRGRSADPLKFGAEVINCNGAYENQRNMLHDKT